MRNSEGRCPSALPNMGAQLPHPQRGGRSAPPPRVTFPSRGKSPKARQGLRPLESPRGTERKVFHFSLPLPLRFPHPLDRVSDTTKDRFATLGLWANRSCFFLWFLRGDISCCQSVARQISCPEDAAGLFYPQPKPLGQRAGGSKGARPPSPGVQGPGGPWRIFAYFLYARK